MSHMVAPRPSLKLPGMLDEPPALFLFHLNGRIRQLVARLGHFAPDMIRVSGHSDLCSSRIEQEAILTLRRNVPPLLS
jgi:hypothetical protein